MTLLVPAKREKALLDYGSVRDGNGEDNAEDLKVKTEGLVPWLDMLAATLMSVRAIQRMYFS